MRGQPAGARGVANLGAREQLVHVLSALHLHSLLPFRALFHARAVAPKAAEFLEVFGPAPRAAAGALPAPPVTFTATKSPVLRCNSTWEKKAHEEFFFGLGPCCSRLADCRSEGQVPQYGHPFGANELASVPYRRPLSARFVFSKAER
jgi:hypothetical protein